MVRPVVLSVWKVPRVPFVVVLGEELAREEKERAEVSE